MKRSLIRRLTRITNSNQFIPEIDGFRFLAISMVVLAHIAHVFAGSVAETTSNASLVGILNEFLNRGTYGVEFFLS